MRTNDLVDVLHELVTFVQVVEAGSFSEAARQQGMTPSASAAKWLGWKR